MKRFLVAAAVLLGGGGALGVAGATFSSTGSGTGTGSTSTLTFSLSATAGTPTTRLLPGGSSDAAFLISNPNAVTIAVISVVGNGAIAVSGGSGCTSANDGVSFTNQPSLNIAVPASANNFPVDLSGTVAMSAGSASGCQGATFSIPVTVTVQQG